MAPRKPSPEARGSVAPGKDVEHRAPSILQPRYFNELPVSSAEQPANSTIALARARFALGSLRKERKRRRRQATARATQSAAELDSTSTPKSKDESPEDLEAEAWLQDPLGKRPSMYSGPWPRRYPDGSTQFSWSNRGFPNDRTLQVEDIEPLTHIQETKSVQDIKDVVFAIMNGPTDKVADSANEVVRESAHNRTIETFKRRGHSVVLVRMHDVKVQDKKNKETYAKCETCDLTERQLDATVGNGPSLAVEQWIATRVLLEMEGNPGGKTADYFKTARDLAQQRVYENADLEKSVAIEMESNAPMDENFTNMLNMVKEALIQRAPNPYHQAKRDEYAAENGAFHHISADIAIVLDKDGRVIAFQFAGAFSALLPALPQSMVAEALDTWTSAWPVPLPDMTRHGLHYISHLKKHPEFDARIPTNNGHTAKSGVSHVGFRCRTGDPNGDIGVDYAIDTNLRCTSNPHLRTQLQKLQYGPFGACTELVGFFFRLLDPELFEDYRKVYENSSLQLDTRREGEFCSLTALLTNLMTNEHKDVSDWEYGFAGLVTVGDYQGGDLLLRELGLQIEAKPGCVQLIRGRELRHSITDFTGRRFVMLRTTHEAVRRVAYKKMGTTLPRLAEDVGLDSCIDLQQEDYLPEDQAILSEREMFPEVWAGSPSPIESSSDSTEEESRKRKRSLVDVGGPSDMEESKSEA